MSADAQVRLQQIWEKLSFSNVKRTIAREPEDISWISLRDPRESWRSAQYTDYKRLEDVPAESRHLAEISWRHYFGFDAEGVYFQRDDYRQLDLDIDLTLGFGERFANHAGGYSRPEDGQLICGEVVDTSRGRRYRRWFSCDEAFRTMVRVVRGELTLSEDELGRQLLTDAYPDMYWAIVRLVMFDNVQAFVDECKLDALRFDNEADRSFARHPAAGVKHGVHGFACGEYGMWLTKGPSEYVHELSAVLDQPQWWEEFVRLADEQEVAHAHPAHGGVCNACVVDAYSRGDYPDEFGYRDIDFYWSETAQRMRQRSAESDTFS